MSRTDLLPMELLKVNYVHQCKQAIMYKSKKPPQKHFSNPARLAGYRRLNDEPTRFQRALQIERTGNLDQKLSPNSARKPQPSLPPPNVESWLLMAKQPGETLQESESSKCRLSRSGCSCSDLSFDCMDTSTLMLDYEKFQSWNFRQSIHHDLSRAFEPSGFRSRAERIARIERKDGNQIDDCSACQQVQPTSRVPKPQEAPSYNESKVQLRVNQLFQKDLAQVHNVAPNWMFQKAASGNRAMEQAQPLSPRLQQKVKQERVHIRKKRQALNIVNRLTGDNVEGATGGDDGKSSHNYSHCSLSIIEQSECPKRLSLESGSDSGVSSSIDSKDQQIKEKNLCLYDKCIDCEKILQRQVPNKQKSYERSIGIPPFKALADPNDVQNFAKKNVTKPSTNDLLTAAFSASQAISKPIPKQCNIETERKLNNLSLHQCNTTICIDDIWVHESCIDSSDEYMEIDSFSLDPANSQFVHSLSSDNSNNSVKIYIGHSSSSNLPTTSRSISTSTSSSVCSGSLCDSEQDSCANCSSTTCNAIAGVFWNNACYDANDINTAATAIACCCSLSSCDDDDCSYYEGNFNVELNRSHQQSRRTLDYSIERNEKELQQKTIIMHELRPRSMDGVIDSVVTLNRDSGLSLESNQHMQSQQDVEAQKLKRGHVLSELLETERIYVNEMSSILKGYCDQMQSDELIHLVPASLQGKEDILFGNLHELFTFHNDIFLKDLENCISTTELVALCFVQRRDTFYRLYSFYCQNIPRSERLRETLVDTHLFLQECQKRLGHKLPLAAYLLKPVQRITKYQLLLKDLLKFSDSGSCTKELQKALDCMLIVLKCVNDSMHQVAITGFPTDLAQLGELLLQDSFQVWTESKKDIRLRIKPQQRHIFLYQKSLLFCKQTPKTSHSKSTYQFKHHLKMSQIGLTETVRGDPKRFEVWLQGRQEVHTLHAPTLEVKIKWVTEIKKVLLNQLEELKGEKIKQYGLNHRGLKQTTSWDTPNIIIGQHSRAINCDSSSESWSRNSNSSDNIGHAACTNSTGGAGIGDRDHPEACSWSSDYSNSEDELSLNEDISTPGGKFIALADYIAMGHSEVSIREGEVIELLKVGCAGWWYVRVLDTNSEGWTPGAYLESINRKYSNTKKE
ncbi:uncharacterized protein LOC108596153 isoform X6 [Drosophila busckii]|uniref:uncharacterized protein LOC108596153 isoform X6 n=1 Tax=Drosophila busckii TaxID=30019 RepID=UPI00083EB429|nr:uncharacterized protein LOC108596153 isoform X6 [Drosophila busckii]